MEYTIIRDSVKLFIQSLCDKDTKIYGNINDYEIDDVDYKTMRVVLDGIYVKYLLSSTSFNTTTNSPYVMAYKQLSKMLDRTMRLDFIEDFEQYNVIDDNEIIEPNSQKFFC